jgi:acetyl-CoA acetyltransferase
MRECFVAGTGLTAFGRHEGATTLSLMAEAAEGAMQAAGRERAEIDGLITGYSTTMPYLMLSTVFAEHFGLKPSYAHSVQLGGATGEAMIMLGNILVRSGTVHNVLVVAGENRLTGQGRDAAIRTLAQVGHPAGEVPLGTTVPAYYALAASRYLYDTGASEADLAELAVLMRRNAVDTDGAHLRTSINVADVMNSRPIASPLKLLDCCPISDGAAAILLSADRPENTALRIVGAAQAHNHQHLSEAPDDIAIGARQSATVALRQAGIGLADIGYGAIYDSFTVTLALLLEAIGFCARGQSGGDARGPLRSRWRAAAEYAWRIAVLRPLRCRRCDGAFRRGHRAASRTSRTPANRGRAVPCALSRRCRRPVVSCQPRASSLKSESRGIPKGANI